MRHDIPPSRGQKKTFLSLSVSGLKVSKPNELFLNYSCMRPTSSLGSVLLIIFINPTIFSIQHYYYNLVSFSDPHNPITFLSPNSLLCPLSSLPPRRHNTHVYSHTSVHRIRHIHTHSSWFLLGGYQFDTGHCDYVFFFCSSQGVEIRDQQTAAKPDSTLPTWGGSSGVKGVKVTVVKKTAS